MTTLTFPLSRIEGHAQAVIEVRDDRVVSAHFQAAEYRGFEHFVQGVPAEDMIVIVPRICGVCSTAHHLAAVKTLEDIYGVAPPNSAQVLRELLMLGQMIQNQATSLFIFTLPDLLDVDSAFQPHVEEIDEKKLVKQAMDVRKAGARLIELAGGQFIHPVKAVIGGMISGLEPAKAKLVLSDLPETLENACTLFDFYHRKSIALIDRIGTWGDDEPACYIAAVAAERPDYAGSLIRVMSPEGTRESVFNPHEFEDHLTFEETDYSFSGRTHYQGQVMRANSLARINMAQSMGTPIADRYLAKFRENYGRPAHGLLLFDLARGIELIYGIERAIEILSTEIEPSGLQADYEPSDGEGFGLVEAPRGPLIHHYVVEKGKISRARFIIPTVHNVMAIERALRVAAERYIKSGSIDLELEKAVGRVVRAFDPCIACATH